MNLTITITRILIIESIIVKLLLFIGLIITSIVSNTLRSCPLLTRFSHGLWRFACSAGCFPNRRFLGACSTGLGLSTKKIIMHTVP